MFTRVLGIALGLLLAFVVTKAVNPESAVVTTVEHITQSISS